MCIDYILLFAPDFPSCLRASIIKDDGDGSVYIRTDIDLFWLLDTLRGSGRPYCLQVKEDGNKYPRRWHTNAKGREIMTKQATKDVRLFY